MKGIKESINDLKKEKNLTNESQDELTKIVKDYENNIDDLNDAIAIRYFEEVYEKNRFRRTSKKKDE